MLHQQSPRRRPEQRTLSSHRFGRAATPKPARGAGPLPAPALPPGWRSPSAGAAPRRSVRFGAAPEPRGPRSAVDSASECKRHASPLARGPVRRVSVAAAAGRGRVAPPRVAPPPLAERRPPRAVDARRFHAPTANGFVPDDFDGAGGGTVRRALRDGAAAAEDDDDDRGEEWPSDGDDDRGEWTQHWDEEVGSHYYFNSSTGEATWVQPELEAIAD